jgi:hypothetical protein
VAVYSNSTDGMVLGDQCSKCIFGEKACPILQAQLEYNYSQHDSRVAKQILETIVSTQYSCEMMHRFEKELSVCDPKLTMCSACHCDISFDCAY